MVAAHSLVEVMVELSFRHNVAPIEKRAASLKLGGHFPYAGF